MDGKIARIHWAQVPPSMLPSNPSNPVGPSGPNRLTTMSRFGSRGIPRVCGHGCAMGRGMDVDDRRPIYMPVPGRGTRTAIRHSTHDKTRLVGSAEGAPFARHWNGPPIPTVFPSAAWGSASLPARKSSQRTDTLCFGYTWTVESHLSKSWPTFRPQRDREHRTALASFGTSGR